MSKVKHLLRKLHIGGGINEHQRLGEAPQPVISPSPNPTPTAPSPGSSSGSVSGAMGGIGAVESVRGDRAAGDGVDFNFLEEEFQVQLALAISASDPDTRQDPEKAQIDAAKRISLICPPSVTDTDALVEFLSLRYWNYKVISYEEKVVDGFYDVYGITSHSLAQGKMPLLVDLQAISFADSIDYEVILVNRLADRELQELEKRAYAVSMECHGLVSSGLIQKLADIVVNKMGGPVGDADEILRRWTLRSYELRNSLNTIILPLGCIDVGLSRHRALLFKVLADRINLPCMLVKGSYYTGTDDGAVNLIKINNGSEYIVDLMGAPGTLIPAEVPSSHLPNSGFNIRGFANHLDTSQGSCLVPDKGIGTKRVSPSLDGVLDIGSSKSDEAIYGTHPNEFDRNIGEKNQTERFEHDFGELIQSLHKSGASSLGISGKPSSAQKSAQKMKVKNVSKYVISAAKDPEFAQKLHAVLLESGASPPPDLFLDINSSALGDRNMLEQAYEAHRNDVNRLSSNHEQSFVSSVGIESSNSDIFDTKQKQAAERVAEHRRKFETNVMKEPASPSRAESEGLVNAVNESTLTESTGVDKVSGNPHGLVARPLHGRQIYDSSFPSAAEYCQRQLETTFLINDRLVGNNSDLSKESVGDFLDANSSQSLACSGHNEMINPLLREVAEWEIPWEDLQIGERIGIGSYGEVYLAEWNGTEVAVKKFLDQDFSGDALVQFKSEVEIMLRLRHPNVVLFMGAVTRSPHFSILTEFLPRGSLYKLLHRPNPQLDERRRMRMALDVAKGMNYLHTSHPPIVHRDLKSPNLLVDKNWVVKVCDFGLSRLKHHTFLSSKSTAGTPEWMAPEVLRNEPANEKCDVYSFGVILWELVTLGIPWKGLNPMQVVGAVGFQNRRLEIPEDVDPAVAQIIRECWQTEQHLRPSFTQLMYRLRRLQRLHVDRTNSTYQSTE